ncbi:hypothetical protein FHG64_06585 [Antarcticibacterium flavum]|uniref:Uncharacterized protein n=1 Tax=Antarcticibacterium flavum TaxID=2058175 RepID=A0A5B7X387_9FLAO|nr:MULTISPECIES: hypothetical protein [Antarcticibacterium]MCM4161319.1 hypothetical protein [Antarcticibacterium sp. W02-3]QCY69098.1 hypothetical protein FHG64_06585 [Antarcticibacterium flavum]
MKTKFFFSFFLATLLFQTGDLLAQTASANQAFWVHEDNVRPSMVKEYEAVTKDFIDACKKHNIKGANFATATLDDGTFLSISPVTNMADLDKNPLAPLAEKMGEDNFRQLFARFNKTYDTHRDYMVHLLTDMSYMPNGLSTNTPGEDYRKWHFFHVTPENAPALRTKMMALRDLYEKKGSKQHFRVYRNGFGNSDYYLVVISAKDAQSYAQTSAENNTLLGPEGERMFDDILKSVEKYETRTGHMRPDLAYTSN